MNLHTHTDYCDGKGAPEDFIKKAIELNFKYLGFSAHAPLPFECNWSMNPEKLDAYCEHILSLKQSQKGKIKILHGFEIDFLEGLNLPSLSELRIQQADYLICSIHFLKDPTSKSESPKFYEIDGTYAQFMLALKGHQYSLKKILKNYLDATEQMLTTPILPNRVKIIGHVDKIVLNAQQLPEFDGMSDWFYQELAERLIENKSQYQFVEINTRALYKKGLSQPYPRYGLLESLAAEHIPLLMNSDAHHPSELMGGYKETLARLETLTNVNIKNLDYKWPK